MIGEGEVKPMSSVAYMQGTETYTQRADRGRPMRRLRVRLWLMEAGGWPTGKAAVGGIPALHTLIYGLFDLC